MTEGQLKAVIAGCYNDVIFLYNGKQSGITSEVENGVPTFQAWHGEATKEYESVDDVMNDPFYSGKSLTELLGEVDFDCL